MYILDLQLSIYYICKYVSTKHLSSDRNQIQLDLDYFICFFEAGSHYVSGRSLLLLPLIMGLIKSCTTTPESLFNYFGG